MKKDAKKREMSSMAGSGMAGNGVKNVAENKALEICAPMSGVIRPLNAVPDPAFAQGLIGDGIAIDPLDEFVRSPVSGTVVTIADTGHALTVRSECGAEILIHIGIDTVQLNGQGFKVLVTAGQAVLKGENLLALDIDLLGQQARSLISPVLVVSGHRILPAASAAADKNVIAAGEVLFWVDTPLAADDSSQSILKDCSTAHIRTQLPLPHGLHARPSGQIARLAKSLEETITITYEGKSVDAASVTALMSLGAPFGSEIEIKAMGARAREAAIAITNLLQKLAVAEEGEAASSKDAGHRAGHEIDHEIGHRALPALQIPRSGQEIPAVIASSGLAAGPVFLLQTADMEINETGNGYEAEQARLDQAIQNVSALLGQTATREAGGAAAGAAEAPARTIAEAHRDIACDKAIRAAAEKALRNGASAEWAWRTASRGQEAELESTGNQRLQERAIDLRDVERQILADLAGVDVESGSEIGAKIPPGSILISSDIAPSLLISMPKGSIAGICTARGGATSHAAILAASAGIPMLVAAGESILALQSGTSVVLDAEAGYLDPAPQAVSVQEVCQHITLREGAAQAARLVAQQPCHLADETRIEIFANLANVEDAHSAMENGAEGCGLLRTEFIFANSQEAPDEGTQIRLYREISEALDGRPVIIRTLDVGGDKPIEYLPFPEEANPALGMRGIRFSLQEEELLRTQIRAMIQAIPSGQLRIMLPMVVEADEIIRVRKILETQCAELGIRPDFQIGIMVETPAAAFLAGQLAAHADFLSIGSNDLSQYVLAMDRGNAPLASRVDAYHPSVLSAIAMTGCGAALHGRWLGICGGLASDYHAAPLLVGLGCQELSAVPRSIPQIKQTLQTWSMERCRSLAARALKLQSAAEVRTLILGEVQ